MTALALISGRLVGDPVVKPTKNGNRVCFFKVRVEKGTALEFWSVATFDEDAINEVAALFDGAPIAATGTLTVEPWAKGEKSGLNFKLQADAVLVGKSRAKRKAGAAK